MISKEERLDRDYLTALGMDYDLVENKEPFLKRGKFWDNFRSRNDKEKVATIVLYMVRSGKWRIGKASILIRWYGEVISVGTINQYVKMALPVVELDQEESTKEDVKKVA